MEATQGVCRRGRVHPSGFHTRCWRPSENRYRETLLWKVTIAAKVAVTIRIWNSSEMLWPMMVSLATKMKLPPVSVAMATTSFRPRAFMISQPDTA